MESKRTNFYTTVNEIITVNTNVKMKHEKVQRFIPRIDWSSIDEVEALAKALPEAIRVAREYADAGKKKVVPTRYEPLQISVSSKDIIHVIGGLKRIVLETPVKVARTKDGKSYVPVLLDEKEIGKIKVYSDDTQIEKCRIKKTPHPNYQLADAGTINSTSISSIYLYDLSTTTEEQDTAITGAPNINISSRQLIIQTDNEDLDRTALGFRLSIDLDAYTFKEVILGTSNIYIDGEIAFWRDTPGSSSKCFASRTNNGVCSMTYFLDDYVEEGEDEASVHVMFEFHIEY